MRYILGAGGLADEVYAMMINRLNVLNVWGFCVSAGFEGGARTHGKPLFILEELLKKETDKNPLFYRAFGDSKFFRELHRKFKFEMESFHHPNAFVSEIAKIGKGVMIGPFAVLAGDCKVGDGCYINYQSQMGSQAEVGKYVHLAPHSDMQDGAKVDDAGFLGMGAVVLKGVTVGEGATIGANAVVTKDVPAYETWAGVPARKLGSK